MQHVKYFAGRHPLLRPNIGERMGINGNSNLKKPFLFNYHAYEQVLNYMAAEMTRNAQGEEIQEVRALFGSGDNAIGVQRLYELFRSGGK